MNTQLLKQHIATYKKWLRSNKKQAMQEQEERAQLSLEYQAYTKERMFDMDEDDIYEYIAPLWAMLLWGNKQYVINKLITDNGLDMLKKQLANLIWGTDKIENRWNEFRKKIKGMGAAMMSELLCKTHPNDCLLWNRRALMGFDYLGISSLPRYDYQFNGEMYAYLCEQGKIIAKTMQEEQITSTNLLDVDYFIWKELQVQPILNKLTISNTPKEKIIEAIEHDSKKEAEFIHNDIRNKLADIGQWLGFNAEVEKKVATGAVVDAVWEVTIGNMGRVIYVFEVQTSGSIDSLILNLMKAKNNKAVQGVVAVTDQKQIEKIKKEISDLNQFNGDLKFWDYSEVLKVHEYLQYVNESINNLGLVPFGL
ncbi:MAG: hypothetical protein LBH84_04880 [Prevotellaceae bacterium]|jgi:hypothetical protein|nr:hypothetical protein [Prevotellaceae bacterium]